GYGPRPNECADRIRAEAALVLVGNHDLAAIGRLSTADFGPLAAASAAWTAAELTPERAAWLGGLEPSARRDGVELYHGSPRDPVWEYVLSEEVAVACLQATTEPTVLVGHSHLALAIAWDGEELGGGLAPAGSEQALREGRTLLNPGSVGQPRDGDPRAAWLLLDLDAGRAVCPGPSPPGSRRGCDGADAPRRRGRGRPARRLRRRRAAPPARGRRAAPRARPPHPGRERVRPGQGHPGARRHADAARERGPGPRRAARAAVERRQRAARVRAAVRPRGARRGARLLRRHDAAGARPGPRSRPRQARRRGRRLSTYRVDGELGRGGMAVVHSGRHVQLDRPVALKVLAEHLAGEHEFRARFLREARIAARLQHPHLVRTYDIATLDGLPCIVMELLTGGTLAGGSLTRGEAADVADALAYAHAQGVVHRDLKPGNLLRAGDGTVKIADFGIARAVEETMVTQAGTVLGTLRYLAPEQAAGTAVGPPADVYSLGVVLDELLAAPTAADRALIARMRDPDPGRRPTAAEVA